MRHIADTFMTYDLKRGDSIASWVVEGEIKHKIQFLCAQLGLVFVDWDRRIEHVDEVRDALSLHPPKMLITDHEIRNTDCVQLLRIAIPELFHRFFIFIL